MSLLQGAEMVPPFLLMYATAVASIIQFQQHMQSGFIFAEAFKQKKAACNLRGNLCCICSVPHHQPSKLASEKVVRSKGGSLMDAKVSKNFFIHHCNSFAASSEI